MVDIAVSQGWWSWAPRTELSGARGGALALRRGLPYDDATARQAESTEKRGSLAGHDIYCDRSIPRCNRFRGHQLQQLSSHGHAGFAIRLSERRATSEAIRVMSDRCRSRSSPMRTVADLVVCPTVEFIEHHDGFCRPSPRRAAPPSSPPPA